MQILDPLINAVLTEFCSRFTPKGRVLWVDEGGEEAAYKSLDAWGSLGLPSSLRPDRPNIVIYDEGRHWLILIDVPRIRGQMNVKRYAILRRMFRGCALHLVFVNAFKDRRELGDWLVDLPWQTAAWFAEEPNHMIHFNSGLFFEQETDHHMQ